VSAALPPPPPHLEPQPGPLSQVATIDVSHLKPSQLTSCGLLILSLVATPAPGSAAGGGAGGSSTAAGGAGSGTDSGLTAPAEAAAVQLVVQVTKQGADFVRCILNPWDDAEA
jgi:hypothetical protein